MRIAKIKWLRMGIIAFIGFIVLFLIYLAIPHSKTAALANGGRARVETASYIRSWRPEAPMQNLVHAKIRQEGLIELWQDAFADASCSS